MKSVLRFSRKAILISIAFLLIIVGIRLALPIAGKHAINWTLQNKLTSYTGHLEDFDLSLYRGAYQLQGLRIWKKDSDQPALLSLGALDLSLSWKALLRGEITADILADGLSVRLIDSGVAEKKQTGTDEKGWQDVLNSLIPISIESLRVRNSQLDFSNADLKEPVFVRLTKITLTAENLRNRTTPKARASSPVSLSAVLQSEAKIEVKGAVNAMSRPPVIDADFELTEFDMTTVNKLLLAYLPLDITKGKLSLYGEVAGSLNDLEGYTKIFLREADVIAPQQRFESFRHVAIEVVSGFANWVLRNSKNETLAARIPFERKDGQFQVQTLEAFWSALDNRKEKLDPGIENSVHL